MSKQLIGELRGPARFLRVTVVNLETGCLRLPEACQDVVRTPMLFNASIFLGYSLFGGTALRDRSIDIVSISYYFRNLINISQAYKTRLGQC